MSLNQNVLNEVEICVDTLGAMEEVLSCAIVAFTSEGVVIKTSASPRDIIAMGGLLMGEGLDWVKNKGDIKHG